MSDIILHHYALSPFSEKIRSMFGYTNMSWLSVNVREWPPRDLLTPLASSYRKIPVAQIGADIFCDTKTITPEISRLSSKPELSIEECSSEVSAYLQEVELEVFIAMIRCSTSFKLQRKVMQQMSFIDLLRLLWDRFKLSRDMAVDVGTREDARMLVETHLTSLESRLCKSDYLFGSSVNIADFATYHSLWFMYEQGEKPFVKNFPRVVEWFEKIKGFGIGHPDNITAKDALNIAKNSEPRSIPNEHKEDHLIGRRVRVTPTDYSRLPVIGQLVGSTMHSWILARNTPEADILHLHFPKQGFELQSH